MKQSRGKSAYYVKKSDIMPTRRMSPYNDKSTASHLGKSAIKFASTSPRRVENFPIPPLTLQLLEGI